MGEPDHDTCGGLVHAVAARLTGGPQARGVRLDFTELVMSGSSGLSALLMALRHTRAADGRLRR
ncbi:STAS domain-containing protein [Streptomyces griseoviridis]|uniref:Anti-anti-sigma regulatory factor n=1 Tax=Streptomyces griseoviridis TaxID=45398 RepID=A0ABT9LB92_STRGD|nr:STAS domain-containing protein [Streptomyces griseoviridis]MDP9680929.1 anti-anti-sigma regulatory factor [Streptomyces griseoviridis]